MSGFLGGLIQRAQGRAPSLQRRQPALFEPVVPWAGAMPSDVGEPRVATGVHAAAPEVRPERNDRMDRAPSEPLRAVQVHGSDRAREPLTPASIAIGRTEDVRAPETVRSPRPARDPVPPVPVPVQAIKPLQAPPRNGVEHGTAVRLASQPAPAQVPALAKATRPDRTPPAPRSPRQPPDTASPAAPLPRQRPGDNAPGIFTAPRPAATPPAQTLARARAAQPASRKAALPATPPAAPPAVQITIGRVEVRALTTAERSGPRTARPAAPRLSLDDYLRTRGNGSKPR